jgi:hypothetical protein
MYATIAQTVTNSKGQPTTTAQNHGASEVCRAPFSKETKTDTDSDIDSIVTTVADVGSAVELGIVGIRVGSVSASAVESDARCMVMVTVVVVVAGDSDIEGGVGGSDGQLVVGRVLERGSLHNIAPCVPVGIVHGATARTPGVIDRAFNCKCHCKSLHNGSEPAVQSIIRAALGEFQPHEPPPKIAYRCASASIFVAFPCLSSQPPSVHPLPTANGVPRKSIRASAVLSPLQYNDKP